MDNNTIARIMNGNTLARITNDINIDRIKNDNTKARIMNDNTKARIMNHTSITSTLKVNLPHGMDMISSRPVLDSTRGDINHATPLYQ